MLSAYYLGQASPGYRPVITSAQEQNPWHGVEGRELGTKSGRYLEMC